MIGQAFKVCPRHHIQSLSDNESLSNYLKKILSLQSLLSFYLQPFGLTSQMCYHAICNLLRIRPEIGLHSNLYKHLSIVHNLNEKSGNSHT
jgi:hypothetical protein